MALANANIVVGSKVIGTCVIDTSVDKRTSQQGKEYEVLNLRDFTVTINGIEFRPSRFNDTSERIVQMNPVVAAEEKPAKMRVVSRTLKL